MVRHYVYIWENVNNAKRYVGLGRGRRAFDHFMPSRQNSLFGRAVRKHGDKSFRLVYLEPHLTREEACKAEIWWIAALQTQKPGGYNLTTGGDGRSAPLSPLEKERRTAFLKANPIHLGHKHSEGAREKMVTSHAIRRASKPRCCEPECFKPARGKHSFCAQHQLREEKRCKRAELRAQGLSSRGRSLSLPKRGPDKRPRKRSLT